MNGMCFPDSFLGCGQRPRWENNLKQWGLVSKMYANKAPVLPAVAALAGGLAGAICGKARSLENSIMNTLIAVVFARLRVVFIVLLAAGGFVAWAQPVPVENPSFELGEACADGWFLSGGDGGLTEDAPHGERAVYLSGKADSQAFTKWQTGPMPFQGDMVCRLSVQAHREAVARSIVKLATI